MKKMKKQQRIGCLVVAVMMMFSLFGCQSAEEKARLEEIAKQVAMTNEELTRIETELDKYNAESVVSEDRDSVMTIKSDLDNVNLEFKCESDDCKDGHSEDCPETKIESLYTKLGTILAKINTLDADAFVKAEAERLAKEKADADKKAKEEAKKKEDEDKYVADNKPSKPSSDKDEPSKPKEPSKPSSGGNTGSGDFDPFDRGDYEEPEGAGDWEDDVPQEYIDANWGMCPMVGMECPKCGKWVNAHEHHWH